MGRMIFAPDAAGGDSPIVNIKFIWSGPGQGSFTNTPDPVQMIGSGNIVFKLTNDSMPGAQFADFYVENNPNWQNYFDSQNVSGNGQTMTVHNNKTVQPGQQRMSFNYVIRVLYGGVYYYDDPVINDDPPPDQWVKLPSLSTTKA